MQRAEFMGIFGLSVHEKIAERWRDLETDTDKRALVNLSETILPAYHHALEEGFDYHGLSEKSRPLVEKIMDDTGIRDGQHIVNYLYFLDELTQAGIIDMKFMNPETPGKTSIVDSIAESPVKNIQSSITTGLESGFNRLLLTGGLVVGGYLVSREIIKNLFKGS